MLPSPNGLNGTQAAMSPASVSVANRPARAPACSGRRTELTRAAGIDLRTADDLPGPVARRVHREREALHVEVAEDVRVFLELAAVHGDFVVPARRRSRRPTPSTKRVVSRVASSSRLPRSSRFAERQRECEPSTMRESRPCATRAALMVARLASVRNGLSKRGRSRDRRRSCRPGRTPGWPKRTSSCGRISPR